MLRKAIIPALAVGLMASAAYAGGNWESYHDITPSRPLSGSECIPADTKLSQGRYPQTECMSPNDILSSAEIATITTSIGNISVSSAVPPAGLLFITSTRANLFKINLITVAGTYDRIQFVTPTNLITGKQFTMLVQSASSGVPISFDPVWRITTAQPQYLGANPTGQFSAIGQVDRYGCAYDGYDIYCTYTKGFNNIPNH